MKILLFITLALIQFKKVDLPGDVIVKSAFPPGYKDPTCFVIQPLKKKKKNTLPSLMAQTVKNLPVMQETKVQSLGQEDPLEKRMATHSSILA